MRLDRADAYQNEAPRAILDRKAVQICLSRKAVIGALAEGDLSGAAFFLLDIAANFQQAVEHFGAFGAAGGQLGIGLFVGLLQAMKLVGNMQRGKDRDLQRIDRQSAGGNLAHPAINKIGELSEVFRVAVRANIVSLIVDLDSESWERLVVCFHTSFI